VQNAVDVPSALPPPRLGVTWDEQQAQHQVIEIKDIDPASPAEIAGMRAGDRILKIDGAAIHGAADIREAALAAPEETTAVIVHLGETSTRTLQLHLQGAPHPIGIFCRTDDAEPGCVIVSRVMSGSTADRAGLRLNDRIRKVGESIVSSPQQFSALLSRLSGPQSFAVERDGEMRMLQVRLPR
jgi:S1-C subfamily serine protease